MAQLVRVQASNAWGHAYFKDLLTNSRNPLTWVRRLIVFVWMVTLTFGRVAAQPPAAPAESRGIWLTTVQGLDFPAGAGTSDITAQRNQILSLLDTCTSIGINTVLLQVRTECDAFYVSAIEPWSRWLTGTQGVPPARIWDPLQFTIDECRRRGLEIHAWFNPYRAGVSNSASFASNHPLYTQPQIVVPFSTYYWLNPGHPDTIPYTTSVIMDVVDRYDVDGIHFDDYFYPYGISSSSPFPDSNEYNAYVAGGGTMSLGDWRRANVNNMITSVTALLAQRPAKSHVRFGISPFGIWKSGVPPGIVGLDAYSAIYADSRRWLREGWVDYFTPQLYWDIASPGQSYTALLEWWARENIRGRHLWVGNAAYKMNSANGSGWSASEITAQIVRTREQPGAGGNVYFNMSALLASGGSLAALLSQGPYSVPAIVPASPWLTGDPPARPSIQLRRTATVLEVVLPQESRPSRPRSSDPRFWVVRARYIDVWRVLLAPGDSRLVRLAADSAGRLPDIVAVSAVDRRGVESDPAIHDLAEMRSR